MKINKYDIAKDAARLLLSIVLTSFVLVLFQSEVNQLIEGGDVEVFTILALGTVVIAGKMISINMDIIMKLLRRWIAYMSGKTKVLSPELVLQYKKRLENDMVSKIHEIRDMRRNLLENMDSMKSGEILFEKILIFKKIQDCSDELDEISSMVGYNVLNANEKINKKKFRKMFFYYNIEGGLRGGRKRCVNLYVFLASILALIEEIDYVMPTEKGPTKNKLETLKSGLKKKQEVFGEFFQKENAEEVKIYVKEFM